MAALSLKPHFSRFLNARPGRLHFAAHSHHPWPDVSFEAQQRAWLDAAALMDQKWDRIFGEVMPEAQRHVARLLHLPDPSSVAFGPNTHDFLRRLLSCVPRRRKPRVLTTDSEFQSFARQLQRYEEAGQVVATRVPVEPFEDFPERFRAAIAAGGYDLLHFSQVFFNSGYVLQDPAALVAAVPDDDALVAVDGYHAFMALPTDWSGLAARAFYIAGGYKYAMSGEGVCFMHCPPGYGKRPPDTGWLAGLGALGNNHNGKAAYGTDGSRFLGATFDPTGLYRFNAVQRWLQIERLDPALVREYVQGLQTQFLQALDELGHPHLSRATLLPPGPLPRGNFLAFRTPLAEALSRGWLNDGVITDCRDDRLRIGFGIYQNAADLEGLVRRIARVR